MKKLWMIIVLATGMMWYSCGGQKEAAEEAQPAQQEVQQQAQEEQPTAGTEASTTGDTLQSGEKSGGAEEPSK